MDREIELWMEFMGAPTHSKRCFAGLSRESEAERKRLELCWNVLRRTKEEVEALSLP
jgi:hypothetical protein